MADTWERARIVRDCHGAVILVADRIRSLRTGHRGTVTRFEVHATGRVDGLCAVYAQWDDDPPGKHFWIEPEQCELAVEKTPDPNDLSMFDLNETEEPDAELDKI